MDLMLVPSAIVPAVQAMLRSQSAATTAEKPLYAMSEDEAIGVGQR